jgi:hypothetical protein
MVSAPEAITPADAAIKRRDRREILYCQTCSSTLEAGEDAYALNLGGTFQ